MVYDGPARLAWMLGYAHAFKAHGRLVKRYEAISAIVKIFVARRDKGKLPTKLCRIRSCGTRRPLPASEQPAQNRGYSAV